MPTGPAGGPRPFAQSEYAIVVEMSGDIDRGVASRIASIMKTESDADGDIIPAQGGHAIALITGDEVSKENLDRVENRIDSLSEIRRVKIKIRPS